MANSFDGKIGEVLRFTQIELKAPKNLRNSFGGYNYRNAEGILEALKPYEHKFGFYTTLSDEIVEVGGRIYVKATATLTLGGDAVSVSAYAREPEIKKGMDEAQITGAASSYARKYALNGLFLLDDTKDADTDEYITQTLEKAKTKAKPKAEPKDETPKTAAFICERCGKPIGAHGNFSASRVAEETKKTFLKQLCYECGVEYKKELEAKYGDIKDNYEEVN